jgi:hypothetical protein
MAKGQSKGTKTYGNFTKRFAANGDLFGKKEGAGSKEVAMGKHTAQAHAASSSSSFSLLIHSLLIHQYRKFPSSQFHKHIP